MILVLDESGDLGFDFSKRKTTHYFIITLLVCETRTEIEALRQGVRRTLRHKIHGRKGKKRPTAELKGTKTSLDVKRYFWTQVTGVDFSLYAIALNKKRVNADLREVPERLYNYLARFVIDEIARRVDIRRLNHLTLIIDKRKNWREVQDFNRYLSLHLAAVIDPRAHLDIDHVFSHEEKAIQAVDLFSWGIFRKYEKRDEEWYGLYEGKVVFETLYLP